MEALPNANSIAYFDTSFHRTIPPHISSYAIRQDIAKKRGLQKYGFHGLSYTYILHAVTVFLHQEPAATNLIVLHLGSGASMCAIRAGKSLDTTMGLTPLNGLPGATRSGAVDPSLIFHYTNRAGRISHDRSLAVNVHVTQAEDILNKHAGWAALTGTTDFGEIVRQMRAVEERRAAGEAVGEEEGKWKLAFDLFVDRVIGYVGSYFAKLGGEVDALVFSGGIGERSVELREEVGVDGADGVVVDIGTSKDKKRVLVCRTDEQLEMAKECALSEKFWRRN
ncbi:putative acetate kinase [Grifola frondosa]|uniref:Probable acetate kinase n=1 Tax=Grifola frondosa TaxID=5627 RepID=A0A1C7M578_GRIFR|nr:putative acetate kinase [Grifola frondosa]